LESLLRGNESTILDKVKCSDVWKVFIFYLSIKSFSHLKRIKIWSLEFWPPNLKCISWLWEHLPYSWEIQAGTNSPKIINKLI